MYYPAPAGYYPPAPAPAPQPTYYYAAPAPQPAPQYYPPAPAYQPPAPAPAYQQGGYYTGYYSQSAPPQTTYQAPPPPAQPQYGQPYYGYGYYGGSPSMSWLDRQREEAQWKSDYYKIKRENEDLRHECAYARAEGLLSAKRALPPPQPQQTPPVVINQPEINLDQLSTLTAQKLYDMHNRPEPDNNP